MEIFTNLAATKTMDDSDISNLGATNLQRLCED